MDLTTNICIGVIGLFALGALVTACIQRYHLIKLGYTIQEELANDHAELFEQFMKKKEKKEEPKAEEGEEK